MPAAEEVLAINRRLLDAIASGDWKLYEDLCDPHLTCFEPEARQYSRRRHVPGIRNYEPRPVVQLSKAHCLVSLWFTHQSTTLIS